MKKQILILVFLVLALFAGTSTAFGQLSPGITGTQLITPLSCAANANFLHPMAGQSYTYQMDGTTGTEDVSQWTWFATKNPAFIATGTLAADSLKEAVAGQLLAASADYGKASGNNSVDITWSPQILANTLYQGAPSTTVFPSPTFVVGYGTGTACADNIKVYEINPIINFTVDITNVDGTGNGMAWDKDTAQCVALVQGATYVGASDDLLMDYGTNTLYFEVAAANFVKDFTPTFRLVSGLGVNQTAVVTLHSSYANAAAGTLVSAGATTNWSSTSVGTDWATGIQFTATSPNNVVKGVSLFVKVVISNTTFESLTTNPFILAVDAQDNYNTTTSTFDGIWDMENADCTALVDGSDQVDRAKHIVKPRPTIIGANIPDSNLAAPNDIVPKNP